VVIHELDLNVALTVTRWSLMLAITASWVLLLFLPLVLLLSALQVLADANLFLFQSHHIQLLSSLHSDSSPFSLFDLRNRRPFRSTHSSLDKIKHPKTPTENPDSLQRFELDLDKDEHISKESEKQQKMRSTGPFVAVEKFLPAEWHRKYAARGQKEPPVKFDLNEDGMWSYVNLQPYQTHAQQIHTDIEIERKKKGKNVRLTQQQQQRRRRNTTSDFRQHARQHEYGVKSEKKIMKFNKRTPSWLVAPPKFSLQREDKVLKHVSVSQYLSLSLSLSLSL
jgi:hypothetical protein